MLSLKSVQVVLAALACLVFAGCSQTATSTYGAKGSASALAAQDLRERKILAARKRARKAKEARRAADLKKREERRAKRADDRKKSGVKSKRIARKNPNAKRTSLFGSIKKKTANKRAGSKKRATSKRRHASKRRNVSKGRKQRIRKTSKAFVPSVSRRAGRLRVNAPWRCVPKRLKSVIHQIRKRWGPVTVSSTHRSHRRNRLVGGKRRSYHLACRAVDFRVHGRTRGLLTWLRRHPSVGGYKRYRSGFFHIDTGPKRTW